MQSYLQSEMFLSNSVDMMKNLQLLFEVIKTVVHLQIWKYLLAVDTSIMPVPQLLAQEFQVLPLCKKELTLFKS